MGLRRRVRLMSFQEKKVTGAVGSVLVSIARSGVYTVREERGV
jgi:hypothetical protein